MSPTKYKPHLCHCCCVPVIFCIRLTLCFFVFNKRMFFKWQVIFSSQSSLNSPWSLCKSLQAWTPAFLRCIRNLIQRWLNHLLFCSPHRKYSLPDHLNNRNKTQLHWIYYTILFLWAVSICTVMFTLLQNLYRKISWLSVTFAFMLLVFFTSRFCFPYDFRTEAKALWANCCWDLERYK